MQYESVLKLQHMAPAISLYLILKLQTSCLYFSETKYFWMHENVMHRTAYI